MKTISELAALRNQLTSGRPLQVMITTDEVINIINQAIDDRKTLNRWFGFMRLMAQRSSWGAKINELLDEYMYGTTDPKVIAAAKRYIERFSSQ